MNSYKHLMISLVFVGLLGITIDSEQNVSYAGTDVIYSQNDDNLFGVATPEFKKIWSKISSHVADNSEVLLKDRNDYGWSLFNSYDGFFEDAIDILTDKESGKLLREIYDINKKIAHNSIKSEELRAEYFAAPDSSWNPFTNSKESIDRDVANLKTKNEQLRERAKQLADKLHKSLLNHGISIDRQQLDFMISSAAGPTLTKMLVVTDTLKQILVAIEKQMAETTDAAICKSYASIYLVTILSLRHAQDLAIADLEQNSKKLDRLIEQAKQNINEAMRISDYKKDKILLNNINLNNRAIEVAKKYKTVLKNYKELILKERPNLERSIKVARNMYNTVTNASSLISIVHKSSTDYKSLFKFSMPVINEIYSANLSKEFDILSEKLSQMD